jgi:hypothetical protein
MGYAFYEQMMSEYHTSSPLIQERIVETFFQRDFEGGTLIPNAILIDMEPKVVQKCLKDSSAPGRSWRFSEKYAHYRQSGSGNNWALGYGSYEPERDKAHAKIQSLLETVDYFGGFQVY